MSFPAVVLAIALVAAPGLGLTFALFAPGRASLPTRAALVVPFGYAAISLTGLVLALAHALYLATFLALYLIETAVAWVVAFRRHGLGEHLASWRREIAEERWTYLTGLLMILGLGAIRLTYSGILNLFDQTPLRYWADGLEIADAHRIPAVSLQWGHLFPPAISKIALNCFSGAASLVLGRGPIAPMGALLVVASMGVFLAAFGLARELGLRFTAPLFVIFLFANRVIGNREPTADLTRYRAESWGRLLMLAAALLMVRAIRSEGFREGLRDAIPAGALFGVLAGTHLVPFVVGITLVGSYAVGRMLVRRADVLTVLKTGAAVAGVAVVLGGFILVAPRGALGFQGAGGGAADAYRKLAVQLGLGPDWDPTLYLAQGKIDQPPHPGVNGFYNSPSFVYREYTRKTVGERMLRNPFLYLLPAGVFVALALLLTWGAPELKVMAIAAVLTAVILLVAALYFSYRYDVYALAQFGERRLFDYTSLPVVMLGLGVGEMLLARVAAGSLPGMPRALPWAAPVAAAVGLSLMAAVAFPRDLPSRSQEAYLATALGPLAWIERNVPCSGRILADRRTLGAFETFTRHAGVLEGMGPYLRPDVLGTAIKELLAARGFFKDPGGHQDYLRSRGVAAVVVTAYNHPLGGALKVAVVNRPALDSARFLEVAARSPSVTVYRVIGFDPAAAASLPDVTNRPGYDCAAA